MYIYIHIYICCHSKRKTEAQKIFLNPFTVCSSCKRKFDIYLFTDKETNRSYLFASILNGLSLSIPIPIEIPIHVPIPAYSRNVEVSKREIFLIIQF